LGRGVLLRMAVLPHSPGADREDLARRAREPRRGDRYSPDAVAVRESRGRETIPLGSGPRGTWHRARGRRGGARERCGLWGARQAHVVRLGVRVRAGRLYSAPPGPGVRRDCVPRSVCCPARGAPAIRASPGVSQRPLSRRHVRASMGARVHQGGQDRRRGDEYRTGLEHPARDHRSVDARCLPDAHDEAKTLNRRATGEPMTFPVTEHYRAYTPAPFTRAEREAVTVLFGGLHWRVERIIQVVLESCGNRAEVLPTPTREDLLTGREVADIGQCCPTSFTTGNLVNFVKQK